MLTQALPDLNAWTRRFSEAEIPVLPGTAQEIEALRQINDASDSVDAHQLAQSIAGDPLMTLKVLSHVAKHRPSRLVTDAETVTAAIVLMGIGPFFRAFDRLKTIDEHLQDQPVALRGLQRVLKRAYRAANFALGFAVHRMDNDAAIIQEAALLHDFAEMLLWCHAPSLAVEIAKRQHADPTLRSAVVQRSVLNVELGELEQALMRVWRLPELLIHITDDRHASHPQVRTVMLAIRLARHTQHGWDNAALPDDFADIAELLNVAPHVAQAKALALDA
ncbi:HDOD domain-containing protein [Methylibium rhizosphaerae]|uniref:HDOD domain-containing protein n=1 Tax=Methylibium rhizosphaerae TaxID=2570323 RepID=UPI00112B8AE9|nr:HDOD domain-containing protein [Methylibium rhizosphaerae]